MSNAAVIVRNLGKRYRTGGPRAPYRTLRETLVGWLRRPGEPGGQRSGAEFWALRHLDLDVAHGEVLGVIGRNGAGKSTLLKLLARITEPTEGRFEVVGRIGALLEVGTGFHPELTGRENIFLSGAILGMSRSDVKCRFDEIVAFSDIEQFLETPVKRYSSGMYMRLGFSVAAHLEPDILIVDEVLAVGDAAFQHKCLGKMGETAREGRTVVLVSHNMSTINSLCTRAILLKDGHIAANGEPSEAISRYVGAMQGAGLADISAIARRGAGRVRFSAFWMEDDRGNKIDHAVTGTRVTLGLALAHGERESLPNCRIGIIVHDALGQVLFFCAPEMVSTAPFTVPRSSVVVCTIPRIPLSVGRYSVSLYLEVNREVEDWVDHAVWFNVVDGDFFGSGRQYPVGWAGRGVLVSHEWSIRPT